MKLTKVCSCCRCGGQVPEAAVRCLYNYRTDRAFCFRCAPNNIRAMYRAEDRRHKEERDSNA